jgi:hypothetical protein
MNPSSFTRAFVVSDEMSPMFGPSGRLDRAEPPVVGVVDVPDLEAGALPGETAGTQRRDPALVRHLAQRVRLVHELGELRRAEEGLDDGGHRPAFTRSSIEIFSGSVLIDIRSRTRRAIRESPTESWFAMSSPTVRTRRFPGDRCRR